MVGGREQGVCVLTGLWEVGVVGVGEVVGAGAGRKA